MIEAVELQVISRILTSDSKEEVDLLCSYGIDYYSVYKEHAEYIFHHLEEYGDVPDVFTFQAQFPDITLVRVSEPTEYLIDELNKNRQHILLVETFNKLKSLGSGDVTDAWKYLSMQCDKINELTSSDPMDIVHDAKERAAQVVEFSKQTRIPTGFAEIDKLMYGGLSTVEELLLIVARTNTGKAQPLWSKVLTPKGWTTMGELKIGDLVVGENNDNGRVIKIFPQGEKDYYRVNFLDGTYVECCDDHLWKVLDSDGRDPTTSSYGKYQVLMLKDIREHLEKSYTVNVFYPDMPSDILYRRLIVSVEYAGKTECQCILLDNQTHTYITDNYTVTHNSWVCTKMMESGQKNGFPVLYYSPEMQSSYLGTRFDTWRGHFQNSMLHQGKYTPQYVEYIDSLSKEETSAFVLEDRDVAGGAVNVRAIENIVKRHKIKLVIIDGLSYMDDVQVSRSDSEKYKNLCLGLFRISKKYGCAVVIAMQANRETKDNKDDKGLAFPSLENVESSDHPGRIATQAFSLRQIFDKHVLDIRLEKSRNANNQKPVLSYAWDVNTGNMQYLPGGDDDPAAAAITTPTVTPKIVSHVTDTTSSDNELAEEDFEDEDVEF